MEEERGVVFVIQIHVLWNKVGLGHFDIDFQSGLPNKRKLHLDLVTVERENSLQISHIVQGFHKYVVRGRDGHRS
jgi:hypothetical protein